MWLVERNLQHRALREKNEVHRIFVYLFKITHVYYLWACLHTIWGPSLVAQMVKNLHAMQETRVRSLGWEDLEM